MTHDSLLAVAYRLLNHDVEARTANRETEEPMDDNMSSFVRRLRRQLGMTQEEFAHALGITVGTVNRWENGRFRPSKLAKATILEFARRHGVVPAPVTPESPAAVVEGKVH